jgi:hypothetical protein
MRIFKEDKDGYSSSLNIIDENNVIVGFDLNSSCCEEFGYKIGEVDRCQEVLDADNDRLTGYVIDIESFVENLNGSDEGGELCFDCIKEGAETIKFALYNYHNGYYGHGWSLSKGDDLLKSGSL